MITSPDIATILSTATSDAERRVARLLVHVDGGPDAVAFHSVKLRSHPRKQQAEADFVVLWKGVVIVVEVKGGGVRCIEGKWWSIDRRQEWNRLHESPMNQANDAKMALREILKEDGLGWYADQHAVITPDVDDLDKAIGWYPSHWLVSSHMTVDGLTRALDEVVARAPQAPARARRARMDEVRKRLFGEFTRLPRIDVQRGAVLEEQSRATAGQARYLEGLNRTPRLIVLGGAGTGKSLALAEGAKQEADQGRSVLITFRSPGLAAYFKTLVAGRGIDVVPFDDLAAGRKYDAVFVDEAQDLMTAEAMDRLDLLMTGGRAECRWRMFLDPNNQAHVDGEFDQDAYDVVLGEAVTFELPMNVRNTKPIVHVVQSYLGADIGDPAIVHGEELHWHDVPAPADVTAAEAIADELIEQGAHPNSIWLVDCSSSEPPRRDRRGLTATSPRHAKGLEADRVIVCSLPQTFDEAGAACFYVAITRARVALHLVTSDQDRKRLLKLLRENMEMR
jgi:Nuclease-related domain